MRRKRLIERKMERHSDAWLSLWSLKTPGCTTAKRQFGRPTLENAVMDKGYDSNDIRARLHDEEINPVIPPKSNRKEAIAYDKDIYKLREKVERFFNKLQQYRRIATRYDKLGSTFLAFIHIVASLLINRCKPPALPGDSQSLTVPGVCRSSSVQRWVVTVQLRPAPLKASPASPTDEASRIWFCDCD